MGFVPMYLPGTNHLAIPKNPIVKAALPDTAHLVIQFALDP